VLLSSDTLLSDSWEKRRSKMQDRICCKWLHSLEMQEFTEKWKTISCTIKVTLNHWVVGSIPTRRTLTSLYMTTGYGPVQAAGAKSSIAPRTMTTPQMGMAEESEHTTRRAMASRRRLAFWSRLTPSSCSLASSQVNTCVTLRNTKRTK